jgi:tetratricopeptide (TPR) repeat protein
MLPSMPFGMRLRTWTLVACVGAVGAVARPVLAEETSASSVAVARKHFEKARACYAQGAYREAITELEAAHALDPGAKDLVFNLGVVHEKLSDIEEALKWFRLYTTMELTGQERDRADAYIRRLEGAKKELEDKQQAEQNAPPQPAPPSPSPPGSEPTAPVPPPAPTGTASAPQQLPPPPEMPPPRQSHGRIDGLTVGAAGLCAGALVFTAVMGVAALRDNPSNDTVANTRQPNSTYQDLVDHRHQAHQEAILADVGLGVSLVAGLFTGYLYFGRTSTASPPPAASTTISAAAHPGGGGFILKGRF